MNIRLLIEYDGSNFFGWQRQENVPTIQASIEDVLHDLVGLPITLYGASRTDSGVHALGQVANFYTDFPIPGERWSSALNSRLPPTIRILDSVEVPEEFHSQRNARSKLYEYYLLNRKLPSALNRRVYHCPWKIDWERITDAIPQFVGEKDFSAFKSAGAEVKTTIRRIFRFDLVKEERMQGLYRFAIEGSGFLKQMVRTIVGTLVEIGEGKREIEDIPLIFINGRRELAGRTVPADGLHLVHITYDQSDETI